jgi:hypothetical protein
MVSLELEVVEEVHMGGLLDQTDRGEDAEVAVAARQLWVETLQVERDQLEVAEAVDTATRMQLVRAVAVVAWAVKAVLLQQIRLAMVALESPTLSAVRLTW